MNPTGTGKDGDVNPLIRHLVLDLVLVLVLGIVGEIQERLASGNNEPLGPSAVDCPIEGEDEEEEEDENE
jgi:hypothetical protein